MTELAESTIVTSIEGVPTSGPFLVRPIVEGDQMSMLEVTIEEGVRSAPHAHSHESILYVVSGELESVIGDRRLRLRAGESCRHPEGVVHSVAALADSVFVEVKSPAPSLDGLFGK